MVALLGLTPLVARRLLFTTAVAAALQGAGTKLEATTIHQNDSFTHVLNFSQDAISDGNGGWYFADTGANYTANMSIPQFDPSLGTLNSVSVLIASTIEGTWSLNSSGYMHVEPELSAGTQDDTASSYFYGDLMLSNGGALQVTIPGDATPNDDTEIAPDSIVGYYFTSSGHIYTGTDMSLYIGTGNLSYPVIVGGGSTGDGPESEGATFTWDEVYGGVAVDVTYDYTPASFLTAVTVPEPSSLGLLAVGGAALLRRRRAIA